jgi:hypothetical protein
MNTMQLEEIFQKLWMDYTRQNPSTLKIHQLFTGLGEKVINDHIAFRTFNDPRIDIDVLARPFLAAGYIPAGKYRFEQKHLSATHFELPGEEEAPRVFISQLLVEDFSEELQKHVRESIDSVDPDLLNSEELIFSGSVFGKPSFSVYESLRTESEYAAWLYVHGFRANHFTVSVNGLESFSGIEEVNQCLKDAGYALNNSGGEIKGSREDLLLQSSTLADLVRIEFAEGTREIPACYYEFAERFRDKEGKLFSGFIAGSADKIFESTDFYNK